MAAMWREMGKKNLPQGCEHAILIRITGVFHFSIYTANEAWRVWVCGTQPWISILKHNVDACLKWEQAPEFLSALFWLQPVWIKGKYFKWSLAINTESRQIMFDTHALWTAFSNLVFLSLPIPHSLVLSLYLFCVCVLSWNSMIELTSCWCESDGRFSFQVYFTGVRLFRPPLICVSSCEAAF